MAVSAGNIPEDNFRKPVAVRFVAFLRMFKVCLRGIADTEVKFHIGDDDQLCRQILLPDIIFNCRLQDQVKYRLQICAGHLAEGGCIAKPIHKGFPLDLDQLRRVRELDEMIAEHAPVMLRKVQSKGQGHGCGQGAPVTIHGSGGINDRKGIILPAKVGHRLPRSVQGIFLLR